ncbi:phage tail protein [Streptomyces sp. IBSBF 2953]|uniref:phage tail protein n=1 Tax=Streptomyces TaxID=1883 RepID=UPI002119BF6B|nr:phage tail protein [Streptomyces scabiei]MCQ9181337.1 phage tail protein [Streptomyces hayashii]MDX3117084.1 phage tail protein [Streptomyces scabiei]
MAQTGERVEPFRNFNFLVELDGIAQASFRECSGLGSTTEVIENREGGDNTTVRKLPGKTSYSDITLKWGLTGSHELWDWRQQVVDGTVARKNGSIVVYDLSNHTEVARWNFVSAWPTKWEGASFSAKGADVAVDTLVLAHEGLSRV